MTSLQRLCVSWEDSPLKEIVFLEKAKEVTLNAFG